MTIGIEATKAYEREKTGVGWYTYYLIREMEKLTRNDVQLRLYMNPATQITNYLNNNQEQNSKSQILSNIQCLSWPFKYFWTQGRLSLEMITNPPDVLFIPAHLPPLIHPKKLVVTIHDLAFKQYPEVYSARERMLQEWGIRQVLKRAWRIIVPSEFTKSEIYKYYPRHKKNNIFVVPHGVIKVQNSKLNPENFLGQNHNLKLSNPYILYIGRLESKKNIVNLIRAFNLLKVSDFGFRISDLILVGSPGYGYESIKKEIMASPCKSDIIQTGWLDREQTLEHLRNATAFVFPSLYEGFGMPLLEAFACGTPVSCSDIPALREVGAEIPLYFNPHDPADIAIKIDRLLNSADLQKQKSIQGIARAQEFTWKKAEEETLEVMTVNI